MHDLKYANSMLDSIKKKIKGKPGNIEVDIGVSLSPLSHVTPERLKETFSMLAREEGYTNIGLKISIAELSIRCRECGNRWRSVKPTFKCPKCGSSDFEMEKWEEFSIGFIDIKRKK